MKEPKHDYKYLEWTPERIIRWAESALITSQYPVSKWHDLIGEPTLADAILDRIVHNAHKITLKGESMRKTKTKLTQADHSK